MGDSVAAVQGLAKALGFVAWVLLAVSVWLLFTDHDEAAGMCLVAAGVLLLVAGPIFRRSDDRSTRLSGAVMLGAAVFFAALGLVYWL